MPNDRLLTKGEAAARLGISARTLDRLRDDIPPIRIGSRRLGWSEVHLNEWIAARRPLAAAA